MDFENALNAMLQAALWHVMKMFHIPDVAARPHPALVLTHLPILRSVSAAHWWCNWAVGTHCWAALQCQISVLLIRSHLLLFFFGRKTMSKKQCIWFKISSGLLAYIYACVLCSHVWIHACRDLVHLDSSGPPGVSFRPLCSHPSTPGAVCLCVCVYEHIHLHTLPPASKIEKTQTTPLSLLLSKINPHAEQQVPFID